MRIKNTIKNSMYSIFCYAITTVLLFWSRRLFLNNLSVEFLGYDSLFKEVLAFVSLADLGVGGAITYRLYEAVAQENENQVCKLMNLYKYVYLILAGLIFAFGLCFIPFLPYLIKTTELSFGYICLIYALQLVGTVSSYLLGYNRIRFQAEQKEYVTIKIDMVMNLLAQVMRIIVLLTICNYIVYVLVTIIQNVGANIWITYKYRKVFGKDRRVRINIEDIKQQRMLADFKDFVSHKLASIIYGGTDNIVISAIMGVGSVTLFTNYTLVANQLNAVIDRLFQPLIASIADMIYKESREKTYHLFKGLDFLFYLIGVYLCAGVASILEMFISVWLGEQFIQSRIFLYLITFNVYIVWAHKALVLYRSTMGNFELDKKQMMLSAVVNLGLSVVLGSIWGFSGIMLGTVLGHLCIWYGRMKVVFEAHFYLPIKEYIIIQIKRIFYMLLICSASIVVTRMISISWLGVILSGITVTIVFLGCTILFFRKTEEFAVIIEYILKVIRLRKI